MSHHLTGTFEVTSWDEHDSIELGGSVKVTVARFAQRFDGDVNAETIADMAMTYLPDGGAVFVGYHRVAGTIDGRSGTLVLRAEGEFDGAEARTSFAVVAGAGTGELAGVTGSGRATAGHGSTGTYTFDLELGPPAT